jgi:hypothetical protein
MNKKVVETIINVVITILTTIGTLLTTSCTGFTPLHWPL